MLRKIFISLALAVCSLAPVLAAPELIGGTVLPGVENQETIEEDSLEWFQNTFLKKLIDEAIGWTAALAVVVLIFGGYQYLTAFGNDEQIKNSHKTIIWSLLGILLALFAFAIVQIMVNINFGKSELLVADAAAILPFAESDWTEISEIESLPQADFKKEFLPIVARFLVYGIAFISMLIFLAAGAWFVMGWGEDDAIKTAKNAVVWAIMGLAFAAGSYILVKGILEIDFGWTPSAVEKVTTEDITVYP